MTFGNVWSAADTGSMTEQGAERYRHLPPPVRVEDKATDPAPDPAGGRDPERDFMLRYAG